MSLMCFFLNKKVFPLSSENRRRRSQIGQMLEMYKGEGLASFGNSNTYCVSPYMSHSQMLGKFEYGLPAKI